MVERSSYQLRFFTLPQGIAALHSFNFTILLKGIFSLCSCLSFEDRSDRNCYCVVRKSMPARVRTEALEACIQYVTAQTAVLSKKSLL